jgi:hypothetical protein
VNRYVHAVVQYEWKTMRDGQDSPRANAELDGLYAAYSQVKPSGTTQTQVYTQALTDLHEAATKRRERLDIAANNLPTMLRVLVAVGLVLLLVLEYRPRLKPAASLVFMGSLAIVVTSAVLLTVVLDYPFAGQVSVSPEPFKQDNLARFWSTDLAYQPKPGDEQQPLTAQRLEGVYDSGAWGALVLRCYEKDRSHTPRPCRPGDRRMRGVFRYYNGTLTGEVVGDVFRGWWAEAPSYRGDDAGALKLRLMETSGGPLITGCYGSGYGPLNTPGWDMRRIGGGTPPDLAQRLHSPRTFIEDPRSAGLNQASPAAGRSPAACPSG